MESPEAKHDGGNGLRAHRSNAACLFFHVAPAISHHPSLPPNIEAYLKHQHALYALVSIYSMHCTQLHRTCFKKPFSSVNREVATSLRSPQPSEPFSGKLEANSRLTDAAGDLWFTTVMEKLHMGMSGHSERSMMDELGLARTLLLLPCHEAGPQDRC